MRPRRVRLGCMSEMPAMLPAKESFNEAEARAPRMLGELRRRGQAANEELQ